MSRSSRVGFTLIELLVVITVIGMLMAMLLPAVGAVRGQMQRLTCLNNQHQIAVVIFDYASKNKAFPGYRQPTILNSDAKNNRNGSWVVQLLPGLGQGPLYDKWRDIKVTPPPSQYMEVLICPSNPPENISTAALSYVVNCGTLDDDKSMPVETTANGLFFNLSDQTTTTRSSRISTQAGIIDGADKTLMISENVNTNTSRGTNHWGDLNPVEADFGFVWWDKEDTQQYRKINHGKVNSTTGSLPKPGDQIRPSSTHTGGVNVAFADTHTMFLRDDIDYWVYQQLCTPDGNHATVIAKDASSKVYIIDAKDYQ